MDQTIKQIIDLDAEIDGRLTAARMQAEQTLRDARQKADAIEKASGHQTRSAITELEEQLRASYEEKRTALRARNDRRSEAMQEQFGTKREELLETLFRETLAAAEQAPGAES